MTVQSPHTTFEQLQAIMAAPGSVDIRVRRQNGYFVSIVFHTAPEMGPKCCGPIIVVCLVAAHPDYDDLVQALQESLGENISISCDAVQPGGAPGPGQSYH